MSAAAGGAVAAAAAAEAEARRKREEEEEMTPYRRDELDADWEFKILRSANAAFKRPDVLRNVLEEEARAGWSLVEKFDDGRIRLKRPQDARRNDIDLDFDPYRTHVGRTENQQALIVVGVVILLLLGVLVAALTLRG